MNLKTGEAFIKFSGIDLVTKTKFKLHDQHQRAVGSGFFSKFISPLHMTEQQPQTSQSNIISMEDYVKTSSISENDLLFYGIPLNDEITSKPIYFFDEDTAQIAKFLEDARSKNKRVVIFEDGSKLYDACFKKGHDVLPSLSDLLLLETQGDFGASLDDVKEVSCYVSAMYYGLERAKEFPLSLRLIREIHAHLKNNARGGNKQPGEFRSSQNWIGGTKPGNARFVPSPPEHLMKCQDHFEKFLHDDTVRLPILIRAALAHVQFETIHPFLDGNGRIGRLLITFMLCVEGIIKQPLLYLSLYLKSNRDAYYGYLQSVRETGDWESWLKSLKISNRF